MTKIAKPTVDLIDEDKKKRYIFYVRLNSRDDSHESDKTRRTKIWF